MARKLGVLVNAEGGSPILSSGWADACVPGEELLRLAVCGGASVRLWDDS